MSLGILNDAILPNAYPGCQRFLLSMDRVPNTASTEREKPISPKYCFLSQLPSSKESFLQDLQLTGF